MQLRLLPFLCLYATVHIQFIAAFPNHGTDNQIVHNPNANQGQTKNFNGLIRTTQKPLNSEWNRKPSTLRTGDNINVGAYNYHSKQFDYYGLSTIHITKNQSTNIISLVGIHNRDSWKTINVLNIKDVTLFDMQDDLAFELAYQRQHYMFKFFDSQKAKEFHQIIKDAQTENLLPVPTVTQSVYQVMHDVESTTSGNQGSNGMVSSDPAQQINYSENRYIATPPSDMPTTEQPAAAQHLSNQPVTNMESVSQVPAGTITTDALGEASNQLKENIIDSNSYRWRMSVNGLVYTITETQDSWNNHGSKTIQLKQNLHDNKIQLCGVIVDITDKCMNVEDIKVFRQMKPPSDLYFRWKYGSVSYELELADKTDADAFKRAMNDAFSVNASTPALPEDTNSVSGDPHIGTTISPTASDDQKDVKLVPQLPSQQNSSNDSRPQQRHICTVSTIHYDCQIQRVHLKHNETYEFGLARDNPNQKITFRDSTLQYLPKSLVDAFPNMTLLNLNDLKIEDIESDTFDSAQNLEHLYLQGNRLTAIRWGVLSGAQKLQTLDLSNNNISTLQYDFRSNKDLSTLLLEKNKITQLPKFDSLPNLRSFDASHNELENIPSNQFIKQAQIEEIDLSYNRLSRLTIHLSASSLKEVDVSNNQLTELNVPSLIVKSLYAENNKLSKFITNGRCDSTILKLSHNMLDSQPNLKSCSSLGLIDLSYNKLEFFDFSLLSGSQRFLNLSHNSLFEILPPATYQNKYLHKIDLSHNKLTYLSSLQLFTALKSLTLNDNNMITIGNGPIPESLKISAANNEWNCDDVPNFAKLVIDTKNMFCREGFVKMQGICCKNHGNSLLLNNMVREAYLHIKLNNDKQKEQCAQKTIAAQNNNIADILQAVTIADKERGDILRNIEKAQKTKENEKKNFQNVNNRRYLSNDFKQKITSAIEKQRKIHRVTNEGLISDVERLSRVIHFVKERNTFNEKLKVRRQEDTENSEQIKNQKILEKENLLAENNQKADANNVMRKVEKDKKKEMEILQKKVNRNAPAIHGKTGKL